MNDNLHQLRCFGCGVRISGTEAQPDFRCAECGDLFEVDYPGWGTAQRTRPAQSGRAEVAVAGTALLVRGAGSLGRVAVSRTAADPGQLWRCGDAARRKHAALLVAAGSESAGHRSALRQAPGHESDRLIQRHGHDGGAERGARAGIQVGGLRIDRQHIGGDGGLRGAGGTAQPGADSRRQDRVGKAFAGDGLWRGHLPAEDRFRRLRAGADADRARGADLSAQLGQSLPAGRPEDARLRDCRVFRLDGAGPPDRAGREPGQQFGAGQGISRTERTWARRARAAHLGDPGRRRESAGAEPGG